MQLNSSATNGVRMKKLNSLTCLAVVLAGVLLSGCNNPESGGTNEAATDNSIPTSVQTEAFEYFGLSNSKPVAYSLDIKGDVADGELSRELLTVGDDLATFNINASGSMAQLGESVVEARPDGVYTVSNSLGEMSESSLELPADVSEGKTWTSEVKFNLTSGIKTQNRLESKIVGVEKIDTPLGQLEALKVQQTNTIDVTDGSGKTKRSQMSGFNWFGKGIGLLKSEGQVKNPDGSTVSIKILIQPTKPSTG
jgi:hypothetical protein